MPSNGNNGGCCLAYRIPFSQRGMSYMIFTVSWGDRRIYDIVMACSNTVNVWLTKKSLMNSDTMKYYYLVNGNYIDIYMKDNVSSYSLVIGQFSVHSYSQEVTILNESVSTLPSGCVEAQNIS